jgi:hypothetical protein
MIATSAYITKLKNKTLAYRWQLALICQTNIHFRKWGWTILHSIFQNLNNWRISMQKCTLCNVFVMVWLGLETISHKLGVWFSTISTNNQILSPPFFLAQTFSQLFCVNIQYWIPLHYVPQFVLLGFNPGQKW